jgi:hypothetical protein
MDTPYKKTYKGSDIDTLDALQTTCQYDEDTGVKLTHMAAIRDDTNERVTFVTYEDYDGPKGNLVFKQYQDTKDHGDILKADTKDEHLFDGTAYVQANIVNVMIFRTKP